MIFQALSFLFSLHFIGIYGTCPSRATTTDVINLISKTNVTTYWIEGGYANLDDKGWVSISTTFTSFINASVFISLPSIPGETSGEGYPAIARVRNVVAQGQVSFQAKLYQANDSFCSKAWHIPVSISPPIEVSWLVVEQGAFSITNQYRVMIGRGLITREDSNVANNNNFIRFNYPVGCVTSTDSCRFPDSASPAIITQLQTVVYDRLLIPRVRSIALSFVRLVLQPHDSTTSSYYALPLPETISYLAYQNNMSISCVEGLTLEGTIFTGVTNTKIPITFTYTYLVPPGVFGIVGSSISLTDSTGLRVFDRTTTGAAIITQEDQCVDEETDHTTAELAFTLTIGAKSPSPSPSCTICNALLTTNYNQPTAVPTNKPTLRPTFRPTAPIYGEYMANGTVTDFFAFATNFGDICISPDGSYAFGVNSINVIRQYVFSPLSGNNFAGHPWVSGSTNGVGTNINFNNPYGVSISPNGVYALITDTSNHIIRQMIISTATVSTIAGVAGTTGSNNGIGTNSKFYHPYGVSISPDGSFALIIDNGNPIIGDSNQIRKIQINPAPTQSPTSAPTFTPTKKPTA